jgi:hypothetical protein
MTLPIPERRPLERLALVIWTTALTALGLASIAAVCWFLVPPITHDAAALRRWIAAGLALELLQMRDMNVLLDAIRGRQLPKLVVDPSFYAMDMYRPDVHRTLTDAIAANYRPAASAPGGRIILYLPRLAPVSP